MLTIKEVFDLVANDPTEWKYILRDFMNVFIIDSDFDTALVKDEPFFYSNIPRYNYVFAACFVHYWCDVMLKEIPIWVFKEFYKLPERIYVGGSKELLNRDTPFQFKQHNLYMRSREVLVV